MSMSDGPVETIPEWDTADRMRKALRHAGMGPGDMAEFLGVAPNTVGTWINGRIRPSKQTLRLWSMRCGVPFSWLAEGVASGRLVRKSAFPVILAAAA